MKKMLLFLSCFFIFSLPAMQQDQIDALIDKIAQNQNIPKCKVTAAWEIAVKKFNIDQITKLIRQIREENRRDWNHVISIWNLEDIRKSYLNKIRSNERKRINFEKEREILKNPNQFLWKQVKTGWLLKLVPKKQLQRCLYKAKLYATIAGKK